MAQVTVLQARARRRRAIASALKLAATVLLGAMGGFVGVLLLYPETEPVVRAPFSEHLSFSRNLVRGDWLRRGWSEPKKWGVWMKGRAGELAIHLDPPSDADLSMVVKFRSRLSKEQEAQRVGVLVNGENIGVFSLYRAHPEGERRLDIPRSVAGKQDPVLITFKDAERKKEAGDDLGLGLESLFFYESPVLAAYNGRLDVCNANRIMGWAVRDGGTETLTIKINEKVVDRIVADRPRPGLAKAGYPLQSSFNYRFPSRLGKGDKVQVLYSDGKPLRGVSCKP